MAEVTIQSNTAARSGATNYNYLAVKFVAGATANVTKLNIWSEGGIGGSKPVFEGRIYSHNAGTDKPDTLLATSTQLTVMNGGTDIEQNLVFPSGQQPELTNGTIYWAAIYSVNAAQASLNWCYSAAGTYDYAGAYSADGTSWSAGSWLRFKFALLGNESEAPPASTFIPKVVFF